MLLFQVGNAECGTSAADALRIPLFSSSGPELSVVVSGPLLTSRFLFQPPQCLTPPPLPSSSLVSTWQLDLCLTELTCTEFYYQQFDSDRNGLASLYVCLALLVATFFDLNTDF